MYELKAINFKKVIKIKYHWMEVDNKYKFRKPWFGKNGWYKYQYFNSLWDVWHYKTMGEVRANHIIETGICYHKPHIHIVLTDGYVHKLKFETREEAEEVLTYLVEKHNLENFKIEK